MPTLGDVPGLPDYLESIRQGSLTNLTAALGELDASLEGDNLSLALQEDPAGAGFLEGGLTFGMAPFPESEPLPKANDPMRAFHVPAIKHTGYGEYEYVAPSLNDAIDEQTEDADETVTDAPAPTGKFGSAVTNVAKKYLGIPYVWGGTSPSGFDCSGLVQYVYHQMGIDLPRLSADQARSGEQIPLSEAKAGDLIAYDNSSRNFGADHIAIAIGNGLMIEAPHTGADVRISQIYPGGWAVRLPQVEEWNREAQTRSGQPAQSAVTTSHAQAVRSQLPQHETQETRRPHAAQQKVTSSHADAIRKSRNL